MNFPDLNLWGSRHLGKAFLWRDCVSASAAKPEALPTQDLSRPFGGSTLGQRVRFLERSASRLIYMKLPFWGSKLLNISKCIWFNLHCQHLPTGQILPVNLLLSSPPLNLA